MISIHFFASSYQINFLSLLIRIMQRHSITFLRNELEKDEGVWEILFCRKSIIFLRLQKQFSKKCEWEIFLSFQIKKIVTNFYKKFFSKHLEKIEIKFLPKFFWSINQKTWFDVNFWNPRFLFVFFPLMSEETKITKTLKIKKSKQEDWKFFEDFLRIKNIFLDQEMTVRKILWSRVFWKSPQNIQEIL